MPVLKYDPITKYCSDGKHNLCVGVGDIRESNYPVIRYTCRCFCHDKKEPDVERGTD